MSRWGVAIGGFMGTGKSTLATALGQALGWPVVDTDAVLVARHGPIAAQFACDGEARFRSRERELVAELTGREGAMVVATGGGTWADAATRASLLARFRTVVLHAPLDVLRARVDGRTDRPLWDDAVAGRLEARRYAYGQAELHLDVAGRSPDDLVAQVVGWLRASGGLAAEGGGQMQRAVTVDLGGRSYPVVLADDAYDGLGEALAARTPRREVVLCTESTVGPLWAASVEHALAAAGFSSHRVTLPAGEENKHRGTWMACVDALLEHGVDRKTPVLALGGGVLGDIVGFAAASTLRGMPFVQLPTTLLAMVDSSVGGKTGVNHAVGKNLVGAFHQPILVYASLAALGTLPPEERRAGLGEVVKTALLGDAAMLERLERDAEALRDGEPGPTADAIARCVEIKADVVSRDELEGGWRAVLNAGHTVAHGLETALGYGALRHGEAVGLGLVLETAWAVREGLCEDPSLPGRLAALLARMGLPADVPEADRAAVMRAMRLDKKADGDKLKLPVPVRPGEMRLVELPVRRLGELLEEPR